MLTRRGLLVSTAAMALWPRRGLAEYPRTLRASPTRLQLAPEGYGDAEVWAYDGASPGPELRVRQGERVTVALKNDLPQASTIHWHGIRIDNRMDGVAGLTQDSVQPGLSFVYDFVAPDAGTYWYHPHDRSWEQMERGLAGALVVEEPSPPETDRDVALVIDDWRLAQSGALIEDFGAMMDWSHAGRLGNWITVNGKGDWRAEVRRGERIRLRLVNVANARIFSLELRGLAGWAVALDGQPLAQPETAGGRITLAPGQRVDLIVDVDAEEEAFLISHERDGGYAIASFAVAGVAREAALPPPQPLSPNPVPPLGDLATSAEVDLVLEGGAMGRMRGAMHGGRMMQIRDLFEAGYAWSMNGVAGMPEQPLFAVERGRTVRVRMVNDTAWPHGMHLHGHHFRQVDDQGALGPLRDTVLLDRGETAVIALHADNPGKWMLHCHMLEHQAAGMATWFEVA